MKKGKFLAPAIALVLCFGAQTASAGFVVDVEPNDTLATAQNIDAFFTMDANADIVNAETMPWVSISSGPDGTSSYDYFSFNVEAGDIGVFDIDYGIFHGGSVDTELVLYNSAGSVIGQNDDFPTFAGAGGSIHQADAFLVHSFAAAGEYVIGVCRFNCFGTTGGIVGNGIPSAATYELQISIENHAVVSAPAALGMFGLALGGLAVSRRKKQ